jgi:hypothetical protein
MTNPKLQIPNPREFPNPNAQRFGGAKLGLGVELGVELGFGSWEFVGIWDLELGI